MDFIREITYRVVNQFGPTDREIYDQRTILTLLELPEAQERLSEYYNDCRIEILQIHSLPYLPAVSSKIPSDV